VLEELGVAADIDGDFVEATPQSAQKQKQQPAKVFLMFTFFFLRGCYSSWHSGGVDVSFCCCAQWLLWTDGMVLFCCCAQWLL
jgi:hypothetical protein